METTSTNIKPKAGKLLKVSLVIFTLLAVCVSFYGQYLTTYQATVAIGAGLAPLIFGGVMVLIVQIIPKFRHQKARFITFLVMQILFTLSGLSTLARLML